MNKPTFEMSANTQLLRQALSQYKVGDSCAI